MKQHLFYYEFDAHLFRV